MIRPSGDGVGLAAADRTGHQARFELADDDRPDVIRVQFASCSRAGRRSCGSWRHTRCRSARWRPAVRRGRSARGWCRCRCRRPAPPPRRPGAAGRCHWRSPGRIPGRGRRAAGAGSGRRGRGPGSERDGAATRRRAVDRRTSRRRSGRRRAARPPCGRSPRNVRGGQRLVSHWAPRFRMIRGLGSSATTSAAHRRASSGIGRLKRGSESSAPNARATASARSTACMPSRGASIWWV